MYSTPLLVEQYTGFGRGRNTVEQNVNLRNRREKMTEHHREVYSNFIDFKRDFNWAGQKVLWKVVRKRNIIIIMLQ